MGEEIRMSNLTNYHSHCSFCDGKAPMEEFVKSAIAAGFTSYGVSSHAPLPFDTRWTLKFCDVPVYLDELERLKRKYAGTIELYAGMEIDYLNDEQNPAMAYFQELPLDYRIGSVHLVYTPCGEIVDTDTSPENFQAILNTHFQGDLKRLVDTYFNASMRMVELGGFDFVGHADKISYNACLCDPFLEEQEWFNKRLKDYFAFIAEKGLMAEVNTKAYSKKGCFFPAARHFRLLKELKIPVLVNSDAHFPELVNDNRSLALQLLKDAGFRTVRELKAGKWIDVEIG